MPELELLPGESAPECPRCGVSMTKKENQRGQLFWGCGDFPMCVGTAPYAFPEVDPSTVVGGAQPVGSDAKQVGLFVRPLDSDSSWTIVDFDAASRRFTIEQMYRPGSSRQQEVSVDGVALVNPDLPKPCYAFFDDAWHSMQLKQAHRQDWNVESATVSKVVAGKHIRFLSPDFEKDPVDALANWVIGKPYEFELRQRFLTELEAQRRSVAGYTAFLSSSIDLYSHQIEVVARVLEDPVPRFILADEVGLGKTIEAGLILKQRCMDGLSRGALVIVPDHLQQQWQGELDQRFNLSGKLVKIVGFSALEDDPDAFGPEIYSDVVVDESHQISTWLQEPSRSPRRLAYAALEGLAKSAKCLLLLSATPQETAPEQMLALLKLLDAEMHGAIDLEEFERKLRSRQEVIDILAMIRDKEPSFYYSDLLQRLVADGEVDGELKQLVEQVCACDDEDDGPGEQVLGRLRALLRESFRLHNRLIRSSRSASEEELHTWREAKEGDSAQASQCLVEAVADASCIAVLDKAREWQLHMLCGGAGEQVAGAQAVASGLYFAACSGVEACDLWVRMRRGEAQRSDIESFFGRDCHVANAAMPMDGWESGWMEEFTECLLGYSESSKVGAVVEAVRDLKRIDPDAHAVVFVAWPGLLQKIHEQLSKSFQVLAVLDEASSEDEIYEQSQSLLLEETKPTVLLASSRVEEGANLQGASLLVHAEIPRNMLRLEQRVGRVDRIGQTKPVLQRFVLPSAQDVHGPSHVTLALDGFGILFQSLSGLHGAATQQFAALDAQLAGESRNREDACKEVQDAIRVARSKLSEERSIDGSNWGELELGVRVAEVDQRERRMAKGHNGQSVLGIGYELNQPLKKLLGLQHDHRGPIGTYKPGRHDSGGLAPAQDAQLRRLVGNQVLAFPATFRRVQAVRGHGRLRRVGDPLINWAEVAIRKMDRGSTYIIERRQEFWISEDYGDASCLWVFSLAVSPSAVTGGDPDRVRLRRFMRQREVLVVVPYSDAKAASCAWASDGFGEHEIDHVPPPEWANLRQHKFERGALSFAGNTYPFVDRALSASPEDRKLATYALGTHGWADAVQAARATALEVWANSTLREQWRDAACAEFLKVSEQHENILRVRARGTDDTAVENELAVRSRILPRIQNPQVAIRSAGLVILKGEDV